MACASYQALLNRYKLDHLAGSLAGSKRMLNHHQEDLPWNSRNDREHQPHDQPAPDPVRPKHYLVLQPSIVLKLFVIHVVLL